MSMHPQRYDSDLINLHNLQIKAEHELKKESQDDLTRIRALQED
jgi:hypothetical protein